MALKQNKQVDIFYHLVTSSQMIGRGKPSHGLIMYFIYRQKARQGLHGLL